MRWPHPGVEKSKSNHGNTENSESTKTAILKYWSFPQKDCTFSTGIIRSYFVSFFVLSLFFVLP
jgi:hypothetical protein